MKIINKSGYPFKRATDGSIGYDLYAIGSESSLGSFPLSRWGVDVPPRSRRKFATGIHIELPVELGAFVRPRSGLALRDGVFAIEGTIDRDYRGDVSVILLNSTDEPYAVKLGERIAQLVLVMVATPTIEEVKELGSTARGDNGFGSTGR